MGTVLFVICIIGVMALVTEVETGASGSAQPVTGFSDADTLSNFNKTFNKKDDIVNRTESLESSINNLHVVLDQGRLLDLPSALIRSSWDVIKYLAGGIGFLDSAIRGVGTFLHLPSWVMPLVILIVVLFFVFSILSVVFGKDI